MPNQERKKKPKCPRCGTKDFKISSDPTALYSDIICCRCNLSISREEFERMFPPKSEMQIAYENFGRALRGI